MAIDIDPLVVVAILGLVNFVKALGVEGKVLTLISMGIGVILAILAATLPPETMQVILVGILGGAGACGLYDLGGMFSSAFKRP